MPLTIFQVKGIGAKTALALLQVFPDPKPSMLTWLALRLYRSGM